MCKINNNNRKGGENMFIVEDLINFLEENELEYIDIVEDAGEHCIFRFSYKFDDVEIEAAKAFADDECKDKDEDTWTFEYYLPYLNDMAIDNITDILQDYCEEEELEYQFIAYDVPIENTEFNDFVAIINEKHVEINLEDYLMDIM